MGDRVGDDPDGTRHFPQRVCYLVFNIINHFLYGDDKEKREKWVRTVKVLKAAQFGMERPMCKSDL